MKLDLERLESHLAALGPAAKFPWHVQQQFAMRAATDEIMVIGGNRSGKSMVGEGIISRLVYRDGPIWKRLRWTGEQLASGKRPIKIWVAPEIDEKAVSLWEPRLLEMMKGLDYSYLQSPHRVISWNDEMGGGEIWLKSQEQGFKKFESDEVDLILFDEEPDDQRLVNSARTRFATTNGVLVMTFTPLKGMTWTYEEIYAPVAEERFGSYKIADRVWRKGNDLTIVQMGMADNPEAVKGGGVARLVSNTSISAAEKSARLYGTYGFTEGLLFHQFANLRADQPSLYIIDKLPDDRPYQWMLTADPNKAHGALLIAQDHEGNRYYCAEHFAIGLPDSQHAEGYRSMLYEYGLRVTDVDVWADPGGAGKQAIYNLAEVGFDAAPVPKDAGSVAASIKRLRRAASIEKTHRHPVTGELGAPHVYFLRNLRSQWASGGKHYDESRLMWEFRQYRQRQNAAPDTPMKKNDDVVDCARYFELVHAVDPEPMKVDYSKIERMKLDRLSRREHEEFDKIEEKAAKEWEKLQLNMRGQYHAGVRSL
jgi:phage terminase large subunit-like protein